MIASEIFELVNNAIGAITNSLLIYLIVRFSRKELGTYKNLLLAFAAYDMFLCALHALVEPKIVTVGRVFSVVAHSAIESRQITAIFVSSFTVPFSLINIHFLYRYIAIRYSSKILYFSDKRVIFLIVLYPTAQVMIWYSMSFNLTPTDDFEALEIVRNEMRKEFNLTVMDGYLIMNHWVRYARLECAIRKNGILNPNCAILLGSGAIVIGANFVTSTSLGLLTYYHINRTKEISFSFKSFQRSILIAVVAQTSVPVLFVYIPYVCVLYFPFFGLPPLYMPQLFPLLLSIFPEWDALVIIFLIRDYCQGLARLFVTTKKSTVVGQTTTWMTSSHAPNSNAPMTQ